MKKSGFKRKSYKPTKRAKQLSTATLHKKTWSSNKTDTEFSKFIRTRDGKCVRCGKIEYLQCSHFWARANSATRYDPENCDTLCYACHYGNRQYGWEYNKQGAYREFKLKQLGEAKYKDLESRANSIVQRKDAIIQCMNYLSTMYETQRD